MIRVTLALALTEVFNRSEHVLCNGFLVFNNLLNDNSFRETLLDTLWHNRFGSSVKQFLLAITKGVSLYVASVVCYTRIGLPVVVTGLLFTGAEVTVSLLIHLSGVSFFFQGATCWVKYFLGRNGVSGGHTEGVGLLGYLFGPLVATLVTPTERFTNGGSVLSFLCIVETISKTV